MELSPTETILILSPFKTKILLTEGVIFVDEDWLVFTQRADGQDVVTRVIGHICHWLQVVQLCVACHLVSCYHHHTHIQCEHLVIHTHTQSVNT